MNTTVVLTLDTRRKKPDGTCSILLRMSKDRVSTQITLQVFVKEKDWDEQKRIIKSSYQGTESVTRLNSYLQKKKLELTDFINRLDEHGKLTSLSVREIKNLFEKKSINNSSFFEYAKKLIEELYSANRIGTARSYKFVVRILKNYLKGKDLKFEQVNLEFLNTLTNQHLQKGNSYNGLAVYMRTIRAIYNKAINEGIVDAELYPFRKYKIVTKKTAKRAIKRESLLSIIDLQLAQHHPLFNTRNYFLISYFMRGIPFIDMALLKVENIVNGRIHFSRQKTDKTYDIKITEELAEIIKFYIHGKSKHDYILPITKYDEPKQQYQGIENDRQRYNKKLKKIAEICDIEENLTSYVSFATHAKNLGIPITAISEMLGHESIKTTQIYLDSLPSDVIDVYHENILKNNPTK